MMARRVQGARLSFKFRTILCVHRLGILGRQIVAQAPKTRFAPLDSGELQFEIFLGRPLVVTFGIPMF
jgi:hypothetical protein